MRFDIALTYFCYETENQDYIVLPIIRRVEFFMIFYYFIIFVFFFYIFLLDWWMRSILVHARCQRTWLTWGCMVGLLLL